MIELLENRNLLSGLSFLNRDPLCHAVGAIIASAGICFGMATDTNPFIGSLSTFMGVATDLLCQWKPEEIAAYQWD